MRLLFLGTGEFGLPCLQQLFATASHEVAAVITQPDRPAGRDRSLRPSSIKLAAAARGVPVLQPEKLRAESALAAAREFAPDLFVVIAYGQILSRAALEIPSLGCLNVHGSLLPKFRGAAPIHAAIREGETMTGVTIMWMDEGLDTGDILLMESTEILPGDTAGSLHDRIARELAPPALARAMDLIADGAAPRIPQDDSAATLTKKLGKDDGLVDWNRPSAEIDRLIRAMTPWPGGFCRLNDGRQLKILEAHPAPELSPPSSVPGQILAIDGEGLLVATGFGALRLVSVQLEGKRALSALEFSRGQRLEPGTLL